MICLCAIVVFYIFIPSPQPFAWGWEKFKRYGYSMTLISLYEIFRYVLLTSILIKFRTTNVMWSCDCPSFLYDNDDKDKINILRQYRKCFLMMVFVSALPCDRISSYKQCDALLCHPKQVPSLTNQKIRMLWWITLTNQRGL